MISHLEERGAGEVTQREKIAKDSHGGHAVGKLAVSEGAILQLAFLSGFATLGIEVVWPRWWPAHSWRNSFRVFKGLSPSTSW